MQRYHPSMITIALLFTMCLFSACVSPITPANQIPEQNVSPIIDVGLVSIITSREPIPISFDEAKGNLGVSESLSLVTYIEKTRVLFIQGGNLDESGNAQRWVFGINKGDTNELRIYDRSGWTILPWNATISAEEIDFDKVISPNILFNKNNASIIGSSSSTIPDQRDIELKNGTYRITMTSGSTLRILIFNATSGTAIESNG